MEIRKDLVFVYVSGGVSRDGGGFGITADGRIIRIPPWNPEVRALLEATAGLVAAEAHVKDAALKQQLQHTADQLGYALAGQVHGLAQAAH